MDAITDGQTSFLEPISPDTNGTAMLAQLLATESPPEISTQKKEQNFWDEARDEGLLVAEWQPLTAVYLNTANAVVIRQESLGAYEDDQCIYMQIDRLRPLIDELCSHANYYPSRKGR